MNEARERQGADASDPSAGEELLASWPVDLSACRLRLEDVEVEEILLAAPNNKTPGTDGVPAEFFKRPRYVRELAGVFQEAWVQLTGQYIDQHVDSEHPFRRLVGRRKWVVCPKEDGVTRTARLRDLEMCSTVRKTIARMYTRILDEQFREQLHPAQQAFTRDGDIGRNNVLLHTFFRDYAEGYGGEKCAYLAAFDCSKGYNRMGWSWIRRCCRAARLPPGLLGLIEFLLPGEVCLVLNGVEFPPLLLLSGLAQGDPLSCFLYILGVDPLLHSLSAIPRVQGISAFVDDWTALCVGLLAFLSVVVVLRIFQRASGQLINIDKSALIPTRRLTASEIHLLRTLSGWAELRISYHERILGLQLGLDVDIADQYAPALSKFNRNLRLFSGKRQQYSFAVRVLIVNVFFFSLFSYVNRFFFMPRRVLAEVEHSARKFLCKIDFAPLGLFAQLTGLYGIHACIRDLRLANVAGVLATYLRVPANETLLCTSLARRQRGVRGRVAGVRGPGHSWTATRNVIGGKTLYIITL